MKRMMFVLAPLLATSAMAAEELQAKIRDIPVQAVWKAGCFMDDNTLASEPQFVREGNVYVGTTLPAAINPTSGQRLPVEMIWSVRDVADAPAGLQTHFPFPEGTILLVVGRFTYTPQSRTVETYTALTQSSDGTLVSHDLGLRLADGTYAPPTANLSDQVFDALGRVSHFTQPMYPE